MNSFGQPRHLAYVITEDWFFASHFLDRAKAAVNTGYKVTVVTRCRETAKEFQHFGIEVENFEFSRRGLNPLKEIATILKLSRVLKKINPDVIHNVALKPVVLGSLAEKLAGVRNIVNAPVGMGYVFTSQDNKARILRPILKTLIKYVLSRKNSRVIIENQDDFNNLIAGNFAKRDAIALIKGAGVDIKEFASSPEPPEPVCVIMVARLLRDKGVNEFIEAAKLVNAKFETVRFLLIGDVDSGNPTSLSSGQLAELKISKYVTWLGARTDIAALLTNSHIVCLPSYREGLPKSLIEAASVGRAIVTTNVTGCREVVQHSINGLLVPPRDANSLALAIETLINDPDLRNRMGVENRRKAETQFANEIIINQTNSVYESFYTS